MLSHSLIAAEVTVIDLHDTSDIEFNESNNLEIEIDENIIESSNDNIDQLDQATEENLSKESISNNVNNIADIWINSNSDNIIFLLDKLNKNIYSNTIKSNMISFLVYGSNPPNGMSQSNFDKLRVSALKSLGSIEEAIIVINNISTYEDNKDFYDSIFLEKSLTDYNLSELCNYSNNSLKLYDESYYLKIRIFCSFLNNKLEEADFYNTILSEENNDEYFQFLYKKLNGFDIEVKNIQEYKYEKNSISLYSAIMRSINLPFTEDFLQLDSPQLLKAIAISPSTDIEVRIAAAQKAYINGSLDNESLAAIYQSVNFAQDELQNPLKTIEDKYYNNPNKSMALLFQSSRVQILPISRLEALNHFWQYATKIDQSKLAYELSSDLLNSIEPTTELIDFSIQTSKAHLHNGNIDKSKDWLNLIEITNDSNNEIQINNDYLQLVLLINLKEGKLNIEDKIINNFFQSLEMLDSDINNLELYLTTLEYTGFEIPTNLWEITAAKLEDDRKIPSIYIMKLIKNSSNKRLLGELFLNIAISLEDKKWIEIHPQHVGLIFDSLKEIKEIQVVNNLTLEILENIN